MTCVIASVNTSRLTTLIVAGCENITDTFLLTCFVPDLSTATNSSRVSFVTEPLPPASRRCRLLDRGSVDSGKSFCRRLNQHRDLAFQMCTADVSGKGLCNSAALNCAERCITDHKSHPADTQVLRPFNAHNTCYSRLVPCEEWTTRTYKMEHLDISGCWKISDLSIRCVFVHVMVL